MSTTKEDKGFVIIDTRYDPVRIIQDSFRYTANDCKKSFAKDSGSDWKYWKINYGFKCVRAKCTIEIIKK